MGIRWGGASAPFFIGEYMVHQEDIEWMPELMHKMYWDAQRYPIATQGRIIDRLPIWLTTHMTMNLLHAEMMDFDPVVENAVRRGNVPCESCYGKQRTNQIEKILKDNK
jgi:hypothetical protein